mgnify:CR=1 FL=1
MAMPVDVRDLMRSGTKLAEERERPVRVAVFVEVDAPDDLIGVVQTALRPRTAAASIQVDITELGASPVPAQGTDAVIALAGSGNVGMRQALEGVRRAFVPLVVVALGAEDRVGPLADSLLQPTADLVVREDPAEAIEHVGAWLASTLGSKRLALAHNFAFVRRAVAEDAVKTTAWQNALIGAVSIVPGTDMPIMTANQAKMLLQIAAAYGQPLGADRIKELAAVVGGGFVLRAIARQALVVVPVLGWAVKGGIGYTGTIAMGRAAISYFEDGADLAQFTAHLREIRDKALLINGQAQDEPYVVFKGDQAGRTRGLPGDSFGPRVVPEGTIFCLGDNRDNSYDSRFWGSMPAHYLKGRAFLIWFSYKEDPNDHLRTGLQRPVHPLGLVVAVAVPGQPDRALRGGVRLRHTDAHRLLLAAAAPVRRAPCDRCVRAAVWRSAPR